ncbi:FxsB family radical SAM/SPASM domain protein, partial [Streptomyces parvus]|nr:FxsB family radical SAM/SPASM domain protein [Streptomyces parvus]
RDGGLHLPTLGTVVLGGPGERGTAVVHPADGGFLVRETEAAPGTGLRIAPDEPEGPHWLPVRVLRQAPAPALLLDDLDPLRDCFDAPAADRLAAEDA